MGEAATSLSQLASIPVKRLFQPGCLVLHEDEEASRAVEEMSLSSRGAVVVENDDGAVTGIFTERDVLVLSVVDDSAWRHRRMAQVMTKNPVTVNEGDSIAEALVKMREGHFRHIPVVDDQGRAIATISIRDVVAYVADHFPAEVQNLPPNPSFETRNLYGG